MSIGGIGAFAGGLAGGFQDAQNEQSVRDLRAQQTKTADLANQGVEQHRANLTALKAKIDDWTAGGKVGSQPTIGDFEPAAPTAAPAATAPPATTPAATPATDPTANSRAQLADWFKNNNLHGLAAGVGSQAPEGQDVGTAPVAAPSNGLAPPPAPSAPSYSLRPAAPGAATGLKMRAKYGIQPNTFGT